MCGGVAVQGECGTWWRWVQDLAAVAAGGRRAGRGWVQAITAAERLTDSVSRVGAYRTVGWVPIGQWGT